MIVVVVPFLDISQSILCLNNRNTRNCTILLTPMGTEGTLKGDAFVQISYICRLLYIVIVEDTPGTSTGLSQYVLYRSADSNSIAC